MKNLLMTIFASITLFCSISYSRNPICGIEQQFQQLSMVHLSGEISRKIYPRIPAKKWKPKVTAYKIGKKCLGYKKPQGSYYTLPISQDIDIWIDYEDLENNYAREITPSFNVGNKIEMFLNPVSLEPIDAVVATKAGRDKLINTYLEFAKITGLTDEALYNLELLKSKIGNDTESLNKIKNVQIEIKNIQKEIQQKDIQPDQERRWNNFEELIRINQLPGSVPNPRFNDYLEILKDSSLPYGIRDDVIEVFSKANPPSEVKNEVLSYLRIQANDVNSVLFDSALFGMAKFGTREDQDFVVKGISNSDYNYSIASILAIGNAQLESGFQEIENLAKNESNLEKRQTAINSLEKFAAQQTNAALAVKAQRTLIGISADTANPFQVKVQAIESVRDIKLSPNDAQKYKRAQENIFKSSTIQP